MHLEYPLIYSILCVSGSVVVWLFCDLMDCSPPGSSVHGIVQARILELVAIPFSGGSSWPGNEPLFLHCKQILYCLNHQGSPRSILSHYEYFRPVDIFPPAMSQATAFLHLNNRWGEAANIMKWWVILTTTTLKTYNRIQGQNYYILQGEGKFWTRGVMCSRLLGKPVAIGSIRTQVSEGS